MTIDEMEYNERREANWGETTISFAFGADGSEHSDSVLLLVALLLEEHEVDEEHGADQRRLHPHVQIHGEAVRGGMEEI